MSLIDIGANLTNRRFSEDLDAVLVRAGTAGVSHIIVTGTSVSASTAALQLAKAHPAVLSATAGVHPHDAKTWASSSVTAIKTLLADAKVVAVGECGLDFNRDFSPRDAQLACFEAQLQIAQEVQKPVFLHQRDAHEKFVELLRRYRPGLSGAVVHCFTGTREEMEEYVAMDCYIGVTGWLCDERRGQQLRDLVRYIPLNRLLIETDAPFLTPHGLQPKPPGNRNEPAFLPSVLTRLADIIQVSEVDLATNIFNNTRALFNLSGTL